GKGRGGDDGDGDGGDDGENDGDGGDDGENDGDGGDDGENDSWGCGPVRGWGLARAGDVAIGSTVLGITCTCPGLRSLTPSRVIAGVGQNAVRFAVRRAVKP
ncbi:MAG TPA: hypothetical protein VMR14_18030, partial [Streptosporangiaceae bacterium]|nr:hypothetical protein [Streptosporangiaceae bacterium]